MFHGVLGVGSTAADRFHGDRSHERDGVPFCGSTVEPERKRVNFDVAMACNSNRGPKVFDLTAFVFSISV